MSGLKIGYARVSTTGQDLTAQREALTRFGVESDRIYVDHGLTGTNRARPGLREAMAACRAGDVLVVAKLDRLARSQPDARDILAELIERKVALDLGGARHDRLAGHGRHAGAGSAQGQALDQAHQLRRCASHTSVRARRPGQRVQPAGAVALQPPLCGADRNSRFTSGSCQRYPALDVGGAGSPTVVVRPPAAAG